MDGSSPALRTLPGLLFPPRCAVCGRGRTALCPGCWRRLSPAPPITPPAGVDRCRALLSYEGAARTLLVRLKYRNERAVVAWLATAMASLSRPAVAAAGLTVVTWAPTTGDRRRARGYDQAELLARGVARTLGLPCRRLLVRAPGPPQTGRRRGERLAGPSFLGVAAAGRRDGAGGGVLLVDDVMTTGATITAAAAALRGAGLAPVAVTVAAARFLKVSQARPGV